MCHQWSCPANCCFINGFHQDGSMVHYDITNEDCIANNTELLISWWGHSKLHDNILIITKMKEKNIWLAYEDMKHKIVESCLLSLLPTNGGHFISDLSQGQYMLALSRLGVTWPVQEMYWSLPTRKASKCLVEYTLTSGEYRPSDVT